MGEDPDAEPVIDARKQELAIELMRLQGNLERLPTQSDIDTHGEYDSQEYVRVFGDLFTAYQEIGLIPASATRDDIDLDLEAEANAESTVAADNSPNRVPQGGVPADPDSASEESQQATLQMAKIRGIVENGVDVTTLIREDDTDHDRTPGSEPTERANHNHDADE